MQKKRGYRLVESEDLNAAIEWANTLGAEDKPEESPEQLETLRATIITGLSYAIVIGAQMGGLPCFDEGQSQEERRKAMTQAARMARKARL